MANSTTTSLNDLLPSIVAEAMFQAQEASIMRNLVKNYTMGNNNGKTITVPKYAPITATAVAEGTDLAAATGDGGNFQQLSTTSAVLEVSEVGVMATVTDLALRTSASNVVADAGRLMGEAIAKKMDTDLIGLFAALNGGTTIGDGTGALTPAQIFEAVAKLRNNGIVGNDIFCVVNPLVAYDMKSALTSTFGGHAGDLSNEALRNGYVGSVAGVNVFESSNVAADGVGAVFHRDALALATMQDIQIEQQRDASLRATELVATAVYGKGELFDNYGIAINSLSSIA